MTEDKKTPLTSEENLDFEVAKDLTIGEATRKDSEIKAGITPDDSVLDKYIKQHRDEVASQKFDTKTQELDTSVLDNFIKKQREEFVNTGLIAPLDEEAECSTEQSPAEPVPTSVPLESAFEDVELDLEQPQNEPVPEPKTEVVAPTPLPDNHLLEDEEDQPPFYKRKGLVIGLLLALLLAILGLVYGLNHQSSKSQTSSTSSSAKKSSSTSTAAKKKAQAFDKLYKSFFVDDKQEKPKNSEFANISNLEKSLKTLKGTTAYADAKSKYDSLKKQIAAVNLVNGKFKTNAIIDGEKKDVSIKDNAKFDDVSDKDLNTGNATLDALLKSVVSEGRKQVEDKKNQKNVAGAPSAETPSATGENSGDSGTEANASSAGSGGNEAAPSNTDSQGSTAAHQSSGNANAGIVGASGYGISSYNPASLQRDRSRVPYNDAVIADVNNPAWAFNPGVLEKIIATSQARGYITGHNFILEKVNVINGNGYYNMFKPDGTYLFSINCKTGYFVGNAPGNSNSLDY